jgi:hypothetical protein
MSLDARYHVTPLMQMNDAVREAPAVDPKAQRQKKTPARSWR